MITAVKSYIILIKLQIYIYLKYFSYRDEVLGRETFDLKVGACPRRDRNAFLRTKSGKRDVSVRPKSTSNNEENK